MCLGLEKKVCVPEYKRKARCFKKFGKGQIFQWDQQNIQFLSLSK